MIRMTTIMYCSELLSLKVLSGRSTIELSAVLGALHRVLKYKMDARNVNLKNDIVLL
jgi:hypothetical protein